MNTYQYTCAPHISYQTTELNSQMVSWIRYYKQIGVDRIFSAPHHPQSNGKLEVFHKYVKPTLKKLCEKDPSNWDKYLNQVLASYRVTPKLGYCRNAILFGKWKGSKSTFAPTIRTHATFSRRSWFWNVKPRGTQTGTSYSKEDPRWKQIQSSSKNHGLNTAIHQNWRQSLLQEQTAWQMGPKMEARI